MPGQEKLKTFTNKLKKIRDKVYIKQLHARTKRRDFSIICNNCWGGMIYQDLGCEYKTPFVGLFLYPDCFLRLLQNLQTIVLSPLRFIEVSKYPIANAIREKSGAYPIGLLSEDVELHFVHYSKMDAEKNWNCRKDRINWDCLKIVLVQRELCTVNHINMFDRLSFPGKVCFSSKPYSDCKSVVWIQECSDKPYLTDLVKYPELYRKRFDVANWINTGEIISGLFYRNFYPFMNGTLNDYRKSREIFISGQDIDGSD